MICARTPLMPRLRLISLGATEINYCWGLLKKRSKDLKIRILYDKNLTFSVFNFYNTIFGGDSICYTVHVCSHTRALGHAQASASQRPADGSAAPRWAWDHHLVMCSRPPHLTLRSCSLPTRISQAFSPVCSGHARHGARARSATDHQARPRRPVNRARCV